MTFGGNDKRDTSHLDFSIAVLCKAINAIAMFIPCSRCIR